MNFDIHHLNASFGRDGSNQSPTFFLYFWALSQMACSKFEYVKLFESNISLLRNTFIVCRIDGHGFHRFTSKHGFEKPNDSRGIMLMNHAAKAVMMEFQDIFLSYGQSDEFSFCFQKNTTLYGRREAKISTNLVSLFTAAYVAGWPLFFGDRKLEYLPSFDARCVLYPSVQNLRDYCSWRQADCHINNLYNSAFWELVKSGLSEQDAENKLCTTDSGQKNEILFQLGINYNNLPLIYKKGTTLIRVPMVRTEIGKNGQEVKRERPIVTELYEDIIKDDFWKHRPYLNKYLE